MRNTGAERGYGGKQDARLYPSGEHYLKCILELSRRGEVRPVDIAAFLNVSKPSVTAALKALCKKKLVVQDHHRRISLTPAGREYAEEMEYRHSIMESFLVLFDIGQETAARDACHMEHVVSNETVTRMLRYTESQTSPKS